MTNTLAIILGAIILGAVIVSWDHDSEMLRAYNAVDVVEYSLDLTNWYELDMEPMTNHVEGRLYIRYLGPDIPMYFRVKRVMKP